MLKVFFNQILFNLKNSKKPFYRHNNEIYSYKYAYLNLLKLNNYLYKFRNKKIILFSDKSLGYYISVLAIFLSGNTWIQISPNIPFAKIKQIIKFSNTKLAIYDESFNNKKIFNIKYIKIISLSKIYNSKKLKNFNNFKKIKGKDISCIFFTSGSSGEPKGVPLSYNNVISCANHQLDYLNYKKNQTFADCHDTSFVMSLVVIFPSVFLNCSISPLVSFLDKMDPITYFNNNKIDNLITVPSFILFNKDKISNLKIKNLILCGESFTSKIMNLLLKKSKTSNIYNCYGATELSPWAFSYKLKRKDVNLIRKFGRVPIGKPFNKINYKFNEHNELIISGQVVAKEYLNNPQETLKKFKKNKNTYSYNTGDIGFKKNNLVFIKGRNDTQVKIKGYRVDLAEIENISRSMKNNIFTFCFKDKGRLILIYSNDKGNQTQRLYNFLKKKLRSYMVPNKIIFLKKIPFNKNGKVDRIKLKKMV
tara:strand:+ start:9121 stop:10551 length:1431 start_codon:yes stop_codon:yes gene_type:complete